MNKDDVRVNRDIPRTTGLDGESSAMQIAKLFCIIVSILGTFVVWTMIEEARRHGEATGGYVFIISALLSFHGYWVTRWIDGWGRKKADRAVLTGESIGRFFALFAAATVLLSIGLAVIHALKVPRGDTELFPIIAGIFMFLTIIFPVVMSAFYLANRNWVSGKFFMLALAAVLLFLWAANDSFLFIFPWLGMLLQAASREVKNGNPFWPMF